MEELKKTVTNLENREYELLNEKLWQVLIETVKFIISNMTKFKKRPKQLSAEETEKIINKDRKKVRQSKKKLKGNINKMLKVKKLNAISKTILAGKEKSGGTRNFRDILSPSSSTNVSFPSSSTGIPSLTSSTNVQSVLPSKSVLDGVPGSQAKKAT